MTFADIVAALPRLQAIELQSIIEICHRMAPTIVPVADSVTVSFCPDCRLPHVALYVEGQERPIAGFTLDEEMLAMFKDACADAAPLH